MDMGNSTMTKSRLIILDADVIIDSLKLGLWKSLINNYQVHVPAMVVHKEVYYYTDEKGDELPVNLNDYVAKNQIVMLEAEISDFQNFNEHVRAEYTDRRVDPGEKEAMVLLMSGRYDDYKFCTGDQAAIKVLSAIGLRQSGVSLEKLLKDIGQKNKVKKIRNNFTEQTFQYWSNRGLQERHLALNSE